MKPSPKKPQQAIIMFASFFITTLSLPVYAETGNKNTSASLDQIRQTQQQYFEQRQQAQQIKQNTSKTVNINSKDYQVNSSGSIQLKDAGQCFPINQLYFSDSFSSINNFYFALKPYIKGKNSVIGQCMNVNDINKLITRIQNRIIDKGYVTTRVVISNQNVKSGNLILSLIPGYVDQIKLNPQQPNLENNTKVRPVRLDDNQNPANFVPATPIDSGDLLNIRDIEQTLENFKRIPSVTADFSIAPSSNTDEAGYSDILINWQQNNILRLSASVDDSGQKSTGIYQGNITASLDNLTWTNDILNLSFGHNLDGLGDNKDNDSWNYSLNYTLPVGYNSLNLSHNGNKYKQTVAGAFEDYIYSGESYGSNITFSHLAHRDNHSKTYLKLGGFHKRQKNFIDDTEVEVQRRRTSGWTASIAYETLLGKNQINSEITYKKGTKALNALTPPEEAFNEGIGGAGIVSTLVTLDRPLLLGKKMINYHGKLKGQYALDALIPANRFSIGGRYTVRGFDGGRSLSADHGALLQQELSTNIGKSSHKVYAGIDIGYVKMFDKAKDDLLLGNHLVGSVVGFKGKVDKINTNYDVFASYALSQPEKFSDKELITGFSLNWQF